MAGSVKFVREAIRSHMDPKDNVCLGVTATCGPPGHPCETCMHLKLSVDREMYVFNTSSFRWHDLLLHAPRARDSDMHSHGILQDCEFTFAAQLKRVCLVEKNKVKRISASLLREVLPDQSITNGVTVPPYLPASKVKGELKEVDIPNPCSPQEIKNQIIAHQQREIDRKYRDENEDMTTPYLVSHSVYIEHNGRFTKAPKHLLRLGDYTTRVCYLEDVAGPEFNTPLDVAIFAQKLFTYVVKVLMGMFAGVALMDLCIVMHLIPSIEEDLTTFFRVYSMICSSIFSLISIFCVLTVIALFDWIDLAHMNLQHLWDTYLHRSIWFVVLPFTIAFILIQINAEINDAIYLHGSPDSNYQIQSDHNPYEDIEFRRLMYAWEVRLLCHNGLVIMGWILMVITRNDDLFLLHLECMKKYDFNTGMKASKQEVANPHIYLPAP